MADRIDDNADLAVAELRRKARRRLVGAIVLALAAAILLPLLLEKEPRSLGDEVSIQIPPVDNGKFVSRLTPDKAKESPPEPKAAAKALDSPSAAAPRAAAEPTPAPVSSAPSKGAPAPGKAAEPATRPITPIPANVAAAGAKAEAPTAAATPPSAPVAPPAAAAKATPAPSPATAPAPTEVPAPSPTPAATPASPAPGAATTPATSPTAATPVEAPAPPPAQTPTPSGKPEGFIIQLAAFTDDKGANSFANKIRKLGYPAYIEPVTTSRGKMWRVRVGGYPTRVEAYDALAKLKAEGHDGLVSAAK